MLSVLIYVTSQVGFEQTQTREKTLAYEAIAVADGKTNGVATAVYTDLSVSA